MNQPLNIRNTVIEDPKNPKLHELIELYQNKEAFNKEDQEKLSELLLVKITRTKVKKLIEFRKNQTESYKANDTVKFLIDDKIKREGHIIEKPRKPRPKPIHSKKVRNKKRKKAMNKDKIKGTSGSITHNELILQLKDWTMTTKYNKTKEQFDTHIKTLVDSTDPKYVRIANCISKYFDFELQNKNNVQFTGKMLIASLDSHGNAIFRVSGVIKGYDYSKFKGEK